MSGSVISVQEFSSELLRRYSDFQKRFLTIEELNGTIMSFLDHGFMVLPNKNNFHKNIRLERQEGCFYVCGVNFSKTLTSKDHCFSCAGKNIFFPHSAVVPDELKDGHSLVKLIIPQKIS